MRTTGMRPKGLDPHGNLLYNTLNKDFTGCLGSKVSQMISIIEGRSDVSLRLLDWFVTKYAEKRGVTYKLNDGQEFYVHISYKAQLKAYKKVYFDPFRRKGKFIYTIKGKQFQTTLGQLNFFKWAFNCNVIEYVKSNFDTIVESMNTFNKEVRVKKNVLYSEPSDCESSEEQLVLEFS